MQKKIFGNIHHPLVTNCLRELGLDRNFLSLINGVYKNYTGNIMFNDKVFKAFPLLLGTSTCYHHNFATLYWSSQPVD